MYIDLNVASAEGLERLPSIGEKMAMRIVKYRRVIGPFQMVRQLQQVKSIGAATLGKVAPFLPVK